jgi:hypothetical protein
MIFRDAAQVLRERGHIKGRLCADTPERGDGPVCLMGAINTAITGDPHKFLEPMLSRTKWPTDVVARALIKTIPEAIERGIGDPYIDLVDWNNDRDRTPEEVIAVLERAAQEPS